VFSGANGIAGVGSVATPGQVAYPSLGSAPTGNTAIGGSPPAQPATDCTDANPHQLDVTAAYTWNMNLKSGTGSGAPVYSNYSNNTGPGEGSDATFAYPSTFMGWPLEGTSGSTSTWRLSAQETTDIASNLLTLPTHPAYLEWNCTPTPCPAATPPKPAGSCGFTATGQKWVGAFLDNPVKSAATQPPKPTPTVSVPGDARDIVRNWGKGTAKTLPDGINSKTYVHIPTCAWIEGAATPTPDGDWVQVYAVEEPAGGGMVWVQYQVVIHITSDPVVYDWGDGDAGHGKSTQTEFNKPPSGRPTYDAVAQSWLVGNPCDVPSAAWHQYSQVAGPPGRHIIASKTFHATAEWFYNIGSGTEAGGPLACGGCGDLPVTWDFGVHEVDQIQGIPYFA